MSEKLIVLPCVTIHMPHNLPLHSQMRLFVTGRMERLACCVFTTWMQHENRQTGRDHPCVHLVLLLETRIPCTAACCFGMPTQCAAEHSHASGLPPRSRVGATATQKDPMPALAPGLRITACRTKAAEVWVSLCRAWLCVHTKQGLASDPSQPGSRAQWHETPMPICNRLVKDNVCPPP